METWKKFTQISVKGLSEWEYLSTESGAVAQGLKAGIISMSSGEIKLSLNKNVHELFFAGGGLGVGVGIKLNKLNIKYLNKINLNFRKSLSVATENFLAGGFVFVLGGCEKDDLTIEDFTGTCVFLEGGASIVDGGSASIMLFGLNYSEILATAALSTSPFTKTFSTQYLFNSAKAALFCAGHTRGLQVGASVSINIGHVKLKKKG